MNDSSKVLTRKRNIALSVLLMGLGLLIPARATSVGSMGLGIRGLDIDLLSIGAGINLDGLYFNYKLFFDLPGASQKLFFNSRSGLRWDQSFFITESDLNLGLRQPLGSDETSAMLDFEGGWGTRQLWLERGRENQPYLTFNVRVALPIVFSSPPVVAPVPKVVPPSSASADQPEPDVAPSSDSNPTPSPPEPVLPKDRL